MQCWQVKNSCQPNGPAMVYKWLKNVRSVAYPARCILCENRGANDLDLCAGCLADLPWQTSACRLCALTLPEQAQQSLCVACQQRTPPFSAAWSLMRYHTPADDLIIQLKFHARLSNARLIAQLMARQVPRATDLPQALLPVPLHRNRWRERGFNQATEIAKPLGRALGLPVLSRAAQRVRATAHQADLHASERKANVRNAFAVAPNLAQTHIAILDDVVTTGATATALALALKQQGVNRVDLWCAARA